MRVLVYVEGPSDRIAMEALLDPLLRQKESNGVLVKFFETPVGDRKRSLLTKVPRKAANIVLNNPDALVVAMPDLYPKDQGFPHATAAELQEGLIAAFTAAVDARNLDRNPRIMDRFRVFCFKHDLEALILASPDGLRARLGADSMPTGWTVPVEDQDFDRPPKRVVEELFGKHGRRYQATVDAPLILRTSNYLDLAERCPQCFKPFVDFLLAL